MRPAQPVPKPAFRRRLVAVGAAVVLACTALLLWQDLPRRAYHRAKNALISRGYFLPVAAPATQPLGAARYDLPLRTLDGKSVSLAQFRGEVIFLNVWASWCPPCRGEMPGIDRLYREAGGQVAFVLLSVDDNRKRLDHYLAQQGYQLPVYLPDSALAAPYRTQSIPATFLIDRQGQIVFRHEGALDYDTPAFRALLASLVAGQGRVEGAAEPAAALKRR
jgi:thiol-disulfide isomerase/thioredoxin